MTEFEIRRADELGDAIRSAKSRAAILATLVETMGDDLRTVGLDAVLFQSYEIIDAVSRIERAA